MSHFEDSTRECDTCHDEVATLSTRNRCDGCEGLPDCDQCGLPFDALDGDYGMCGSCLHNALRSGWGPE